MSQQIKVSQVTQAINKRLQNDGQPMVQQLQPSRLVSLIISQVLCYGVILYIRYTYNQSINVYTIMVLATSV